MNVIDCLIIGSGMSGLTIANLLQHNGIRVKIVDKGRGIGGRIATRRIIAPKGDAIFDYGAQFFTVRDRRFKAVLKEFLKNKIVRVWTDSLYSEEPNKNISKENYYVGTENMRQITKFLANKLDISQSTKVLKIVWKDKHWKIYCDTGEVHNAKILVLTSPIPQTLQLIEVSGIYIDEYIKSELETISYEPCIALLGICSKPTSIPEPGGIFCSLNSVSWIADNSKKGISTNNIAVTIHARPNFSKAYWLRDDVSIFEYLKKEISEYIKSEIVEYQVHKWLYSKPIDSYSKNYEFIKKPGPIFLAGDAFVSPRVEGAFLSGYETGKHIIDNFASYT